MKLHSLRLVCPSLLWLLVLVLSSASLSQRVPITNSTIGRAGETIITAQIESIIGSIKNLTTKAETADTIEKVHEVVDKASLAFHKANADAYELALISDRTPSSTFDKGWQKYVNVLVDVAGAVMVAYSSLFSAYDKGVKKNIDELNRILDRVADRQTYHEQIEPYSDAAAGLGMQVSITLDFMDAKDSLISEEWDPFWRVTKESEQKALDRSYKALTAVQKVVLEVYDGMKVQLSSFVRGMVDGFIVLNRIRAKIWDNIEEDENEERQQALDDETDQTLELAKEALWEMAPGAPYIKAYNAIVNGEEIGFWGWFEIVAEIGLELLALLTGGAGQAIKYAAKSLKVTARTIRVCGRVAKIASRVNKVAVGASKVSKVSRVGKVGKAGKAGKADKKSKLGKSCDGGSAELVDKISGTLENVLASSELVPLNDSSPSPQLNLATLLDISNEEGMSTQHIPSDDKIRSILKSLDAARVEDEFTVETTKRVCTPLKPLEASLLGTPRPNCRMVKTRERRPRPTTKEKRAPTETLGESRQIEAPQRRSVVARQANQQELAKDLQAYSNRLEGDEFDADLAGRILARADDEFAEMEDELDGMEQGADKLARRDKASAPEGGGFGFLDNEKLANDFMAQFTVVTHNVTDPFAWTEVQDGPAEKVDR
ncbi:hypothetical protein CDD83_8986 [Cordyceps sp. RAO-2017]|nr:hypothetical protein CDD83_8986 [Cordyceps sp. RAO-2017]